MVLLLVETLHGDVVGVRFPDTDAARRWEDQHQDALTVRGCVRAVSKTEALEGCQ